MKKFKINPPSLRKVITQDRYDFITTYGRYPNKLLITRDLFRFLQSEIPRFYAATRPSEFLENPTFEGMTIEIIEGVETYEVGLFA
ncbi:hypothetical protein [Marinicella marina]|uniref:hypothetical protein n=1 Tax=Marinicella marina TaxID=2996016 RepID=UPI0024BD0853|nr:hypothetical protein [Marinicella marina]MDJ1139645.1 hypothetical protein [Marinicella marina]